jgi:hypothetical protein
MSTDSQHPRPEPPAAREPTAETLAASDAEERADLEEDRRRQRDLDDAELGGEA